MRRFVPVAVLCLGAIAEAAETTPPAQTRFTSPPAAMQALVAAARSDDPAKLLAILGLDGEALVSSGDAVADADDRRRFVARATERTRFETLADDQWRFDTAGGREELLSRRIGRNELMAIAAIRAYVDAQEEYARTPQSGGAYAQKLCSAPGQRDGLYWDDADGADQSPLGPLFASASAEGYQVAEQPATPQPYHGYLFRILAAQGGDAGGGAGSYVKDGKMTGGFALVAWRSAA